MAFTRFSICGGANVRNSWPFLYVPAICVPAPVPMLRESFQMGARLPPGILFLPVMPAGSTNGKIGIRPDGGVGPRVTFSEGPAIGCRSRRKRRSRRAIPREVPNPTRDAHGVVRRQSNRGPKADRSCSFTGGAVRCLFYTESSAGAWRANSRTSSSPTHVARRLRFRSRTSRISFGGVQSNSCGARPFTEI
jgi:hypothetical protein